MEAEEGGYLVPCFYVVVADGALPGLTVVYGFDETGPIFFDGVGVDFLRVHSEVDDSLLHHHSSVVDLLRIFSDEAGYEIAIPLSFFELKLALNDMKHIVVAFDLAAHPTLSYLYLILLALDADSSCAILEFDSIVVADDSEVELGGVDGDGGLVGSECVLFGLQ